MNKKTATHKTRQRPFLTENRKPSLFQRFPHYGQKFLHLHRLDHVGQDVQAPGD
jgi:hypothetical protein